MILVIKHTSLLSINLIKTFTIFALDNLKITIMINEKEIRKEVIENIAGQIAIAARTAPKSRGIDNIEIFIAETTDINKIIVMMEQIAIRENQDFFSRDAENLRNSDALIIIAVKTKPANLNYCGMCGMKNCETKNLHPAIPCAFNMIDLGISVGSAVSKAMDFRADNRIMYTIGIAVKDLGLIDADIHMALGIPLSSNGKNIFFDRIKKQ